MDPFVTCLGKCSLNWHVKLERTSSPQTLDAMFSQTLSSFLTKVWSSSFPQGLNSLQLEVLKRAAGSLIHHLPPPHYKAILFHLNTFSCRIVASLVRNERTYIILPSNSLYSSMWFSSQDIFKPQQWSRIQDIILPLTPAEMLQCFFSLDALQPHTWPQRCSVFICSH